MTPSRPPAPSARAGPRRALVAGFVVLGVSQAGVWWARGFDTACAASSSGCGLTIGRTGAALVTTAASVLAVVVLLLVVTVAPGSRSRRVPLALATMLVVSVAGVVFTTFSTGFILPG